MLKSAVGRGVEHMDDNNNTVDQEITRLQELIQTKQDVIDQANKDMQRAALDLRKAQKKKSS